MLLALLQAFTVVSADTGGIFYHRGPDTLRIANQTWVSQDSAPKMPDCVYSGLAQRMMARDSMRVSVNGWTVTLRPGEVRAVDTSWALPSGRTFHLVRVYAPRSVCGVNAGQVAIEWALR